MRVKAGRNMASLAPEPRLFMFFPRFLPLFLYVYLPRQQINSVTHNTQLSNLARHKTAFPSSLHRSNGSAISREDIKVAKVAARRRHQSIRTPFTLVISTTPLLNLQYSCQHDGAKLDQLRVAMSAPLDPSLPRAVPLPLPPHPAAPAAPAATASQESATVTPQPHKAPQMHTQSRGPEPRRSCTTARQTPAVSQVPCTDPDIEKDSTIYPDLDRETADVRATMAEIRDLARRMSIADLDGDRSTPAPARTLGSGKRGGRETGIPVLIANRSMGHSLSRTMRPSMSASVSVSGSPRKHGSAAITGAFPGPTTGEARYGCLNPNDVPLLRSSAWGNQSMHSLKQHTSNTRLTPNIGRAAQHPKMPNPAPHVRSRTTRSPSTRTSYEDYRALRKSVLGTSLGTREAIETEMQRLRDTYRYTLGPLPSYAPLLFPPSPTGSFGAFTSLAIARAAYDGKTETNKVTSKSAGGDDLIRRVLRPTSEMDRSSAGLAGTAKGRCALRGSLRLDVPVVNEEMAEEEEMEEGSKKGETDEQMPGEPLTQMWRSLSHFQRDETATRPSATSITGRQTQTFGTKRSPSLFDTPVKASRTDNTPASTKPAPMRGYIHRPVEPETKFVDGKWKQKITPRWDGRKSVNGIDMAEEPMKPSRIDISSPLPRREERRGDYKAKDWRSELRWNGNRTVYEAFVPRPVARGQEEKIEARVTDAISIARMVEEWNSPARVKPGARAGRTRLSGLSAYVGSEEAGGKDGGDGGDGKLGKDERNGKDGKTKKDEHAQEVTTPPGSPPRWITNTFTPEPDPNRNPKRSPPPSPINTNPPTLRDPKTSSLNPVTPAPRHRNRKRHSPPTPFTPSRSVLASLDRAIDDHLLEYAARGVAVTPGGQKVSELLERRWGRGWRGYVGQGSMGARGTKGICGTPTAVRRRGLDGKSLKDVEGEVTVGGVRAGIEEQSGGSEVQGIGGDDGSTEGAIEDGKVEDGDSQTDRDDRDETQIRDGDSDLGGGVEGLENKENRLPANQHDATH
ncbi:uncharacterized protein EI97DRAFT_258622 [Westerdykella ornata]|uniref:Uncharacterized protein n=1 Tax=Westerdykella ornata TaxID=318751 RepID=A0A6A6J6I4_WESOR|nr:uncharacterized protein EI97DRAFT_258622 [Westerdykella ornata]KAF2271753.1 hypothetical protein EI97DRAFT_258622 [Westerdykella ornata]